MEIIEIPQNENNKLLCDFFVMIEPCGLLKTGGQKYYIESPHYACEAIVVEKLQSAKRLDDVDYRFISLAFGRIFTYSNEWIDFAKTRFPWNNLDYVIFDVCLMQKIK